MKFSEIEKQTWKELQPYLDTALLPLTGLSGSEQPWEATEALEQLRDALDLLEIPFKGRVVTYPAIHYALDEPEAAERALGRVCARLKQSGFRYVVAVAARKEQPQAGQAADLVLRVTPEELAEGAGAARERVAAELAGLWSRTAETDV